MSDFPKISVITPSYNQAHFLEETILSVLGQNYPNLEYIIIDGGSNDNSVEIIKKYESKLAFWISEKDSGQSNAINKGFVKATGDILCWLNSDDMFMPGILNYVAKEFADTNVSILTGSSVRYGETPEGIKTSSHTIVADYNELSLKDVDYIMQPSTFWRTQVWNKVGKLNENLHFVFDWEWFLRAETINIPFKAVNKTLSIYRIHGNQKTGTGGNSRHQEIINLYTTYSPENVPVFKSLINSQRRDKGYAKILRHILKFSGSTNVDTRLLKILHHEFRNFSDAKLKGILLASI